MPQFPYAEAARRFTDPDDRARFTAMAHLNRFGTLASVFNRAAQHAKGPIQPPR